MRNVALLVCLHHVYISLDPVYPAHLDREVMTYTTHFDIIEQTRSDSKTWENIYTFTSSDQVFI